MAEISVARVAVVVFGWMILVTGGVFWLTGEPTPLAGAVIAALLFVPPVAWVERITR